MYPAASASVAAAPLDTSSSITICKLYFSLLYFNAFLQYINYIIKFKMSRVFGVDGSATYMQKGQASDRCRLEPAACLPVW